LLLYRYPLPPHDLLSFPTRRSSDLRPASPAALVLLGIHRCARRERAHFLRHRDLLRIFPEFLFAVARPALASRLFSGVGASSHRSEEHTSELQSHLNLVCRLLLEKK